ncbi:MAG: glycosyltransferase [Oscillospiraceae bacterium]|nr:glycosyltransferase [Oscillospiraceae bacterium]
MSNPKISVIIPVYNTEQYLKQCLDSVINQTLTDIEIICVDDGSTDRSLSILQEYASKDPRFKILQQKNQYAGVARNNGMKVATGKYYMFLDADDFFEPKMLEALFNHAEETEADICLCSADTYDQRNGTFSAMPWFLPQKFICQQPLNRDQLPEKIFQITGLAPWNKLFSARFVQAHALQFQAVPRANDVYFSMCALALAGTISAVQNVFVHYRVGMSDNLQANNHRSPLAFCEALDAVHTRLLDEALWEKVWISFADNALSQSVYNLKKLRGTDACQMLAEALHARYLDEWGIRRGIEESRLDKTFSRELLDLLEDSRFPTLRPCRSPIFPPQEVPYVSIIIPVYNVEAYLQECLDSVISQTLKNIEIICVNDGSTDGSAAILEEYRQKDPRVRIIFQKNAGLSAARNAGISASTGEFLLFLDSDDYLDSTAAEKLYALGKENSLDLLFFDLVSFYDETGEVRPPRLTRRGYDRIFDGVTFMRLLKNDNAYITSACLVMLRREFLVENSLDFYPGIIHEDELFCFRILMEAKRATFIDSKLYHRRIREQSIMTAPKSAKNAMGYFVCMREILRYGLQKNYGPEKNQEITRAFDAMKRATAYLYGQLDSTEKEKLRFDDAFSEIIFNCFIPAPSTSTPASSSVAITAPAAGDRRRELQLEQRNRFLLAELDSIQHSLSYRLGRLITWFPRKIRGFFRCLQENGGAYTRERILVHLGLREDPYRPKPSAPKPAATPQNSAAKKPAEPPTPAPAPALTPEMQYRQKLITWYRQRTNKELDLDNVHTLNEKLQWLKLYDCLPLKTVLADKYLYRNWVEENFGPQYLIPLLGVWNHFDEVDVDALPNQFAIKTNHGSSWNIIVKDKSTFDRADASAKFTRWLSTNFGLAFGQELHYAAIQPRIIVEEYHPCQYEYQFWCFNGEPKFISAIHEPHGENSKASYDLNWNKLDFVTSLPRLTEDLPKPPILEDMTRIAREIGSKFSLVRVDFLYDGESLFIGEITFTPASGVCRWDPEEYDKILGDMLTLPPKSPIPEITI